MENPSRSRSSDAERLVVGLVRGVHGLHGAVRIEVLTDRPEERFAKGAVLHPEGATEALTVAAAQPVADGPGWRVNFREVADRTAAERLRGVYLEAIVSPTETPGRGEYYWHEVIGVAVTDVAGNPLGTVRDVYRAGGAEVFVVDGGPVGSFDVPAVRAFIRIFAPRRGEIVVDAEALDLRIPNGRGGAES
jgi:16S rRNA processing protein RimM